MPSVLTPPQRYALEAALAFADLRDGRGDTAQRDAFAEYEWRRCAESCEYWLDTYGWIVDGGRITRWRLWPIQRWVVNDLQAHQSIVGVKARQLGITTTIAHFALWDCIFREATTWDNISANEDKAKDILKRVQATKDRLPSWMTERAQSRNARIGEVVKRADKADATTRIAFGLSEMKIATSTIRAFQGASSNMNVDEATLHLDLKRKLQQMAATLDGSGGVGSVIANGNGRDEFFFFYQQAKLGVNGFKPYFFWWGDDPSRLEGWMVDTPSGPAEATQMSRDDLLAVALTQRDNCPWYAKMRDKFLFDNREADEFAFMAVYPTTEEEAFFLGGNSLFSPKTVNTISAWVNARAKEPKVGDLRPVTDKDGNETYHFVQHATQGRFRLYEEPVRDAKYCIAADPSGGGADGDYAVLRVSKLLPGGCGEDALVYQGKTDPATLALHAYRLGRWYNTARQVPERNMHGGHFIDKLKEMGYPNFYLEKSSLYFTDEDKEIIGYYAGQVSKTKLVDGCVEWLGNFADYCEGMNPEEIVGAYYIIHDAPTIAEISHFERTSTGKMQAPKGFNDDLVITYGLAIIGIRDLSCASADPSSYPNPLWW